MKLIIPDEKRLVHEMVIPIRWGDMDAMGHVNNTVYFRYMEVVRVGWLHGIGGPPDPEGAGPVVVNAYCTFMRQFEWPGDVRIKLYVGGAGRSSFETYTTMERADAPGVICAEGGATTVWTRAQKSVPLPDRVRQLIESGGK